jgi:diguanylate cyclase (GGDEF)-like protein
VIARRLEAITRPTDTLARTGGDEFVLLCPETDADGGASIAHRVTTVVAEPIVIGDVVVEVGASVGVAHREGDRAIADQLLIEADDAMYRAKRAGRGLVRLAGEV